jgi:hypothetical protein
MRNLVTLLATAMLISGLTGCAANAKPGDPMKAKCPACGHEFVVPGAVNTGP